MTTDIDWNTATLAEMKAEHARRFDAFGGPVCERCEDGDELCAVHAAEAQRERAERETARDRARARELYEAAGRPVPEWAR